MIVVKVELHSAISGQIMKIGEAVIYNDGTGTNAKGNYETRSFRAPNYFKRERGGTEKNVVRRARVERYDRVNAPVLELVSRALQAMGYGKENVE